MSVERFTPQPQSEYKEAFHPMRVKIETALQNAVLEKDYVPDKERQARIFDRIDWEMFLSELGVEGQRGEAFRFKAPSRPRRDNTDGQGSGLDLDGARTRNADLSGGQGKQIRGKLFEMLIQADPEFGERTPLEKELLALAHNPAGFGLEKELGVYRNPDMAFLLFEGENGVELVGVGESKLGLLNERSYKQLSESGFTRGAHKLIEVVNNLPDPATHGLFEVAKVRLAHRSPASRDEGGPIRVADDFTQLLVVPANRNIEWKSTLVNRREFSREGRQQFYELLEDTTRVRTAKAAFSTAEVAAMARALST